METYENVFCYFCNTRSDEKDVGFKKVPFRMLLSQNIVAFEFSDTFAVNIKSNERCIWKSVFDSVQEHFI
jgi:hypothetical protein